MPDPSPSPLAKAQMIELEDDFSAEKSGGKKITVQFNPESLKLAFANQIATGPGNQTGNSGQLYVGAGTTKLTLQLWFDATRQPSDATAAEDVRDLTRQVTYFISPQRKTVRNETKYTPPATRFQWGTFTFEGILDGVEETLDYWSADGKPLRATMNVSMSQQKIEAFELAARKAGTSKVPGLIGQGGGTAGRPAGTTPLAQAPAGATLQSLADQGSGLDWQSVAAANGIENPRLLQPGQLLNLNPTLKF